MKRGIGKAAVEGIINRHIDQQVDWQNIKAIPLCPILHVVVTPRNREEPT
jgi:hypothetical protein